MAGGAGERFWPLSRKRYPKQLLHLNSDEHSMIEETILRIEGLIPPEDIYIITNELLVTEIRKQLSVLPPENVIPEPYKRNTAPCLALASAYILARYAELQACDIAVAVLTTDQNISTNEQFTKTIDFALNYAEQNQFLVTIGIMPSRPDTGYGYIETAKPFSVGDENEVQAVVCFKEKPNVEQARDYIKTGRYTWNSGMFFWRLDTFIEQLQANTTEIGKYVYIFTDLLGDNTNIIHNKMDDVICGHYDGLPNISIDYALMEKSSSVAVCKALFEWDDIGAWDALDRTKGHDANGNVVNGATSIVNCNNSILLNECSERKVIVAGLGLKGIVVIATDDAILVCPKDEVQNVKRSVEDIHTHFSDTFL
jgi:mannose-1-phosphate guanylyltransferase